MKTIRKAQLKKSIVLLRRHSRRLAAILTINGTHTQRMVSMKHMMGDPRLNPFAKKLYQDINDVNMQISYAKELIGK